MAQNQNKIYENGGKIYLNNNVVSIKNKNDGKFEIITDKEIFQADILISTLPLDKFTKMFEPLCKNANIIKSSNRLNYLALRILYLIVKRKNILRCQYCYFIDRPYNRVSDLNLFSNNLTNEKNSALSVEISCHKNSDIWHFNDEEIYKLCLDSLEKDNLISKNDIVEWKVLKIPMYILFIKLIMKLI